MFGRLLPDHVRIFDTLESISNGNNVVLCVTKYPFLYQATLKHFLKASL
jgi:hypothetical protein